MSFKITRAFDLVVLTITYIVLAGLLLSYLTPYIAPDKFWPFAFFGLAYPFLLLGAIVFLIYWSVMRKWISLGILAVILIGYNRITGTIGINTSARTEPADTAGAIKVLTYNIHFFRGPGNAPEGTTSKAIQTFLSAENPDIVCFQEFWTHEEKGVSTIDSIKHVLKVNEYYYRANGEKEHTRQNGTGMVIYSRYPIVAQQWIKLSEVHNQCLVTDVKKGNSIFRIYNVHFESIGLSPEELSRLKATDIGEKQKIWITRSIGSSLKHAFIARSEQVRKVKEHAGESPYPYIIAGDFNDTPVSYAVHEISEGLKNTFVEKGKGFCRTYNGKYPNFQIDYVLVSPDFDVLSYKVGKVKYSDHFPVITELKIKEQAKKLAVRK